MDHETRLFVILFSIIIGGCSGRTDDYSGFFCDPVNNDVNISIDSLELERIQPQVSELSYVGYSGLCGDKLYFADGLSAKLYQFDRNGNCLDTVLRYGNGPHEIPVNRLEAYCISDQGHHFFLDSTTNLYDFDKDFDLVNSIFYYWSKKLTEGDLCEQTNSYTTAWGDNVNLTVHNGMFYTNVYGESEDFNITIPEYYETARIIEPRDAKTGEPFPLLGRITPAVGYMTAFQKDFFRITDSGDFFVAYEADDLIYVYDSNYKLNYSFGQPGKNMNKNYKSLSVDNFRNDLLEEEETKGRYTSLCVVGDLTFRTYRTGTPKNETRLQIYDRTTLIGDVQVPYGFKVMGYIEPYYYSEFICDEDKETIEIYRFKL